MKTRVSTHLLLSASTAAVTLVLALAPAASAQTDLPPVKHQGSGFTFGMQGNFKSTDGTSGTFKQTEVIYDEKSTSETTVYTRRPDQATRTETTTYLTNPDGTHTENFTSTDYGATAAFTSSQTVTSQGRGQSTGQGTYLAATGTTGTLTTLQTISALGINVLTTIYNSPTAGVSSEQRTQTETAGKTVIKSIGVDPTGKPASVVLTRMQASSPLTFQP